MSKTLTAALAAFSIGALAIIPAAHAAEAQVRFNDLDLSTAAGKSALDQRIERAARSVCATPHETGTILRNQVSQSCLRETRKTISEQIALRVSRGGLGG